MQDRESSERAVATRAEKVKLRPPPRVTVKPIPLGSKRRVNELQGGKSGVGWITVTALVILLLMAFSVFFVLPTWVHDRSQAAFIVEPVESVDPVESVEPVERATDVAVASAVPLSVTAIESSRAPASPKDEAEPARERATASP